MEFKKIFKERKKNYGKKISLYFGIEAGEDNDDMIMVGGGW